MGCNCNTRLTANCLFDYDEGRKQASLYSMASNTAPNSTQFLQRAVSIVTGAIAADQARRYDEAIAEYNRALEYFMLAVKYERSEASKEAIRGKINEYMARAEKLKNSTAAAVVAKQIEEDNRAKRERDLIEISAKRERELEEKCKLLTRALTEETDRVVTLERELKELQDAERQRKDSLGTENKELKERLAQEASNAQQLRKENQMLRDQLAQKTPEALHKLQENLEAMQMMLTDSHELLSQIGQLS